MPRIFSRINAAPSSTSARKSRNASRFRTSWSGFDARTSTSRVWPDAPPATWQLTHFAWPTDAEIITPKTSSAVSLAPRSGAVERFVRCPVGLDNRFITWIGDSEATLICHLPLPSPSDPWSPAPPVSSSAAETVRDTPAGTDNLTSPTPGSPRPSTPLMITPVASAPLLTKRSWLTCSRLLPGLNTAIRWRLPMFGAMSCMAVRKPFSVRM